MKTGKKFLGVLVIVLLIVMSFTAAADGGLQEVIEEYNLGNLTPLYMSYKGTVAEISGLNGKAVYSLENNGEIVANVIIDDDTYIVGGSEILKGDILEAFYYTNAPMIMIYPPQIKADVAAVNFPETKSIKVDRYYDGLLSMDLQLKLNISDETEIILQDGTPFDGEIAGRALAVIYTVTTRSIPPQTTPEKIVVLFEKIMPLPSFEIQITEEIDLSADINGEMVVNDEIIDEPAPYINENGVVMIPLRAVCEKLGYELTWDGEAQCIFIDNGVSLTIGNDCYEGVITIMLGTAPELVESNTFVPLSFFKKVMNLSNAYVFEGQIVINNFELVQ